MKANYVALQKVSQEEKKKIKALETKCEAQRLQLEKERKKMLKFLPNLLSSLKSSNNEHRDQHYRGCTERKIYHKHKDLEKEKEQQAKVAELESIDKTRHNLPKDLKKLKKKLAKAKEIAKVVVAERNKAISQRDDL